MEDYEVYVGGEPVVDEDFARQRDESRRQYLEIYGQDCQPEGASGWIQWKGTDVCMDIDCPCGFQGHIDTAFFYCWKCPECGQKYATGQTIKMIPLTDDQAERFPDDLFESNSPATD